jgi:hypothetical protein
MTYGLQKKSKKRKINGRRGHSLTHSLTHSLIHSLTLILVRFAIEYKKSHEEIEAEESEQVKKYYEAAELGSHIRQGNSEDVAYLAPTLIPGTLTYSLTHLLTHSLTYLLTYLLTFLQCRMRLKGMGKRSQ